MKPNKYGVIYSTPLPDKFFQTPEGLTHGIQMEPVDLTVNKRGSPPSAGSSPSSLKFPSHRRASPVLSMPPSSPPIKKYSPPSPGVQPFSVPLSMPPVMAAALSRHGIRSPGILPVIQPVVVQPVPFMYTSHIQQPLMVSLSEEMDSSNSSMQGKVCHAPYTQAPAWWTASPPQEDGLGYSPPPQQFFLFSFCSVDTGRMSSN